MAAKPAADANSNGPDERGILPATAATAEAWPEGIALNLSFSAGPLNSVPESARGRFRPISLLRPAFNSPAAEADRVDFNKKR